MDTMAKGILICLSADIVTEIAWVYPTTMVNTGVYTVTVPKHVNR